MGKRLLLGITAFFFGISATAQNVGIGEGSPGSKMSVQGNMSIGNNYSSIAAPKNSLIVEGMMAIGTSAPDTNAILDMSHSRKGVLLPRLCKSERVAVNNIEKGMVVYDTDSNMLYFRNTNGWCTLLAADQNNNLLGISSLNTGVGAVGPTGATGPQGLQGIQGAAGANGTVGTQGPTGATGMQGIQGIAGTNGANGATGPQGLQGVAGAQGPQGVAGANGAVGATGTKGATGSTGATGAQGIQGITGPQGLQGTAGTNGTNGTNGVTGATGATGVQGIQGVAGAQGPQGIQGAAGTNGTNGAVGATGATGMQGATGPSGISTVFGACTASVAGMQGAVPAPPAGSQNKFLTGAGGWVSGFPLITANGANSSTTEVRDYNTWVTRGTGFYVTDVAASINNGIPNEGAWFTFSQVAAAGSYFGQTSLNDHDFYYRGGTVANVSTSVWQKMLSIPASSRASMDVDASNNLTINNVENAALAFATNGTERMQIDKNGNVGIGTTAPGNKLEVNSGTAGTSGLRLKQMTAGSLLYINSTNDVAQSNSNLFFDATNNRLGVAGGTSPNSTLTVGGSLATAIVTKTSSYSATASDHTILCNSASATVNITMPAASGCAGRIYVVKRISGSGSNTVVLSSGGNIDGASSYTLSTQNAAVMLQSDGSAWYVISKN